MNVTPLTPLTSLKVLQGVELNNKYTDTLFFNSVSEQISNFSSKAKYSFTNLAPIRVTNVIRVPICADKIYNCNYIMFQNANFNSKWFYAFINEIKFININMCEVSFEIDSLQTWLFEMKLKPCLVEREHSSTDKVGDNLLAETIDTGDYIVGNSQSKIFKYYAIVVAVSESEDGSLGALRGGVYSGLTYKKFFPNVEGDIERLNAYLDEMNIDSKNNSIVNIFMCPEEFVSNSPTQIIENVTFRPSKWLGNYIPKNNKLLTYPYKFINVSTVEGANSIYRPEFFNTPDNTERKFEIVCSVSCSPELTMYPIAYRGYTKNYLESVNLSSFPQCEYNTDSFKNFLSQKGVATALGFVGSGVAMATGNVVGGAMGLASSWTSLVQNAVEPNKNKGGSSSHNSVGGQYKGFYINEMYLREENAKVIDDYFSMYGYACRRLKVPNISSRPFWNYVQTSDCKIGGNLPFEDNNKICSIFNSGITFWKGGKVGEYLGDNSPIE